jgi:tetratricopeptide (TPR) repeat protein
MAPVVEFARPEQRQVSDSLMTTRSTKDTPLARVARGRLLDSERAVAALLALFALLLRAVYLLESAGNPFRHTLGLDPANYDRWARLILGGTPFGPEPFFQAPLYPYFLALCYAFLGVDPLRPLWVHALLGAATTYLGARIAHRYWGRPGLWAAGLLLALYKPAIFYTGVLLVPVLATFLLACALWFAPHRALLAGLCVGLAGLAHPVLLPGGLIGGLGLAAAERWRGTAMPGVVARAGTGAAAGAAAGARKLLAWLPSRAVVARMSIGALIAIAPATVHNLAVSGHFVPMSVNSGINLFIGNGPGANGFYRSPFGMRGEQDPLGIAEAARQAGRPLDPVASNRFWSAQARAAMGAHPGHAVALFLRKIYLGLQAYETPQIESLDFEKRYSWLMRIPILPNWIFLLSLSAMAAVVARRRIVPVVSLIAVLAMAIAIAVFFVTARFRMPGHLFLALAGSGAIAALLPGRGARASHAAHSHASPSHAPPAPAPPGPAPLSRVRLGAGIGAAVACALLFGPNWLGVSRAQSFAQYHYRLGVLAEERDDTEGARREYVAALAADADVARANINLGILTARTGDLEKARALLERGITLDPRSARGYLALGQIEQVRDNLAAACSLYAHAWAVDTTFTSSLESLATASYLRGDLQRSLAQANELVRRVGVGDPLAARTRFMLEHGAERKRTGMALWTTRARAEGDLAFAAGDLAAAETAYAQACATDPRDGAAWLERARVAARRGDHAAAAAYAARSVDAGGPPAMAAPLLKLGAYSIPAAPETR